FSQVIFKKGFETKTCNPVVARAWQPTRQTANSPSSYWVCESWRPTTAAADGPDSAGLKIGSTEHAFTAILGRHSQEPSMSITIDLPPAKLKLLQAEAAATGKDVETVVRDAVDARLARRKQTFAEVLKPIHEAVEASGLSDDEVNELLDKELKDARTERPQGRTVSEPGNRDPDTLHCD